MLNRIWGRTPPLRPDAQEAIDQLGKLAESRPELRELAAINAALLKAMLTHPSKPLDFDIEAVHGATKLEAGLPLLRGETIWMDQTVLRDRFVQLCEVMASQGHDAATELGKAARRETLLIGEIAQATLNGEPQMMARTAAELGLDAGLAATLLRYALFPLLQPFMQQQRERFDIGQWKRGYCWCCGAWALLGEFRGLEQARILRCGVCASEWEIDRLMCPVCENRVHQDFLSLAVESEGIHQRAVACERCHTYVKHIATLVPIPPLHLFVSDLQTLHLDLIAIERQYMAAY